MRVVVIDENLLWSERLRRGALALGHECTVVSGAKNEVPLADVAIVNLGSTVFPSEVWIPRVKATGALVVAHAGHKEKPLLEAGNVHGADLVVSNSELTNKLEAVLEKVIGAAR